MTSMRREIAPLERYGRILFWFGLALVVTSYLLMLVGPDNFLHVSPETAGAYNAISGIAWLIALLLSLSLLLIRVWRYRHEGIQIPALLWRDLISKSGLAEPLVFVFGARIVNAINAVPATSPLTTYVPWLIVTTVPALMGMWTFLWYEVFVIDRWQADA
jgi:hypothetical protein